MSSARALVTPVVDSPIGEGVSAVDGAFRSPGSVLKRTAPDSLSVIKALDKIGTMTPPAARPPILVDDS